MNTKSILIVSVDFATAQLDLSEWERAGAEVHVSNTFAEAMEELQRSRFDMLIVDARFHSDAAFAFCRTARATNPGVKLGLIVSDAKTVPGDLAVDALIVRQGKVAKGTENRISNNDR